MLAIPKTRRRTAAVMAALVCGALGLATPWLIDGSDAEFALRSATLAAATRDSFTLSSPVAFDALPRLLLERGNVSFAKLSGEPSTGAAVLALLTAGKGRLVLDNAVLSLDLVAAGAHPRRVAPSGGLEPLLAALASVSFSELDIRNSQLRVLRSDGSTENLALTNLAIKRERGGRFKATGIVALRGQPVSLALALGARKEADQTATWPLELELKNDHISAIASGTVSNRETLAFESSEASVDITSVRKLARWLGADWTDGRGLERLSIKGPMEWTPRGISFPQASIDIDGNEGAGTLSIKLANQRAALDGTVDFETLDVTSYVDQLEGNRSIFDFSSYLPPTLAFRPVFPILNDIDADLRISAGKVKAWDATFGKSAASFSLKNGTMLADLAELEVGKAGRCRGQLTIDAQGIAPSYHLKGSLENVDASLVSQALFNHAAIGGTGTTTLDLKAEGADRQSIVQSLSGKLGVRVPSFGQLGVDLNALSATTRAAAQTGWGGAARGTTSLNSLAVDFNVVDGRLNIARASARTGDAVLTAVGNIELPNGRSDLRVWMTRALMQPVEATPGGAEFIELPSIANATTGAGLLIEGPIRAPTIRQLPLTSAKQPPDPAVPAAHPPAAAPSTRAPPGRT